MAQEEVQLVALVVAQVVAQVVDMLAGLVEFLL